MSRSGARIERRTWTVVYAAALACPLLLMVIAPFGEPAWATFAVALGFIAFAGMSLQVVLAARLPSLIESVGVGPLIRVHRYMGSALVLLVLLHVLVLIISNPWSLHWLWPWREPLVAKAGTIGLLAMIGLGVTSVWRARLGISYDRWRVIHVSLTTVAIAGAYVHVLLASSFAWSPPLRWYATALVLAAAVLLVYLRVIRAFRSLDRPLVICEVRPERGRATTLVLRTADGQPLAIRPAQVAWLKFHGRPYSFVEHPFTIASRAGSSDCFEVTIKASGDTTSTIHELPVGTDVLLDGPHGGIEQSPGTSGWILVAAGIGITPAMGILRSIAHDAAAAASAPPTQLIYGVRSWEDATFRDELEQLAATDVVDVHVAESAPGATPASAGIHLHARRVDHALLASILPDDRARRSALVCGPVGFDDIVVESLISLGVPPSHVHAERFAGI